MAIFSRTEHIERLKDREFDILIIGGGITGAGIARDAAMRGLSVALLEARDYCSGTSSKSSKMLHGGIRYLEQFQLGLVFEASQERRLHSDLLAPHLASPVPYLIPIYPWSPHSKMAVTAGVYLYDTLALFRNHGTRILSKEKSVEEEPNIEEKGLKGGVVYHDVVMDDARIGIENVRSAAHHGAVTVNYANVRGFEKDGTGKIRGAWVKDTLFPSSSDFLVKAKCFVNAAGPWSDYIRKLANPEAEAMLRPTKGAHIILPNQSLGKKHAFVLTAKSDDRVFFSVPWFGRTLVGTTDTDYDPATDGPLDDIHANQNEVDYLMESVKRTFPGAKVGPQDVQSSFAGLRPLVSEGNANNPSAVSREHRIWQEDSGLLNIAGGKYTTYRTMAAELLKHAIKYLKKEYSNFGHVPGCRTQLEPIVLPPEIKDSHHFAKHVEEYTKVLDDKTVLHLQSRYGARWQRVADLAIENKNLRERIVESEPDLMAEVIYTRDYEMAVHFEDFLRRRTMLALKAPLLDNFSRVKEAADLFGEKNLTPEKVKKWQGLDLK